MDVVCPNYETLSETTSNRKIQWNPDFAFLKGLGKKNVKCGKNVDSGDVKSGVHCNTLIWLSIIQIYNIPIVIIAKLQNTKPEGQRKYEMALLST